MYSLFRDKEQIACMDPAGSSWATHIEEVKYFCRQMLAMCDFDSKDPSAKKQESITTP